MCVQLGKSVATLFGIFSEENRYDRNPDSLPPGAERPKPSGKS